ncbi:MAG: uroporphyrinogen-III C-methyltransferase [Phycisphaerae bacterium]|nr:uroporphyrinogen-III C-methyltransferase [Phycisphaerae bacterium]
MSYAKSNTGLVVLVGGGPGAAQLLTAEAAKWISRADVVIYDRLANPELLRLAPATAEKIYVGKSPGDHSRSQEQINALLIEKAYAGRLVVRLKGGDPLIFGRGGEEADALAAAGCAFRIVPGITAAIAAGAYAGIPLTDRRLAGTLALVTGNEDPAKDESAIDFTALAGIDTVVFYMGVGRLAAIAEKLIAAGKPSETPAAVVENATTPAQRTITATLGTLAARARQMNVNPPALIVVGPVVQAASRLGWFEKLPLKGQTVLITRTRRQASRLAEKLAERGAAVIQAPAIEIAPLESFADVDDALGRLGKFDWIAFTSPNGVVALIDRAREIGLDCRVFAGTKIAAVGTATAEALSRRGIEPDLMGDDFTTESLGKALIATGIDNGDSILLVRSDIATPQLPEMLTAAGAKVEQLAAYRTIQPAGLPDDALAAIRAGKIDWITFTSTSTVENFLRLAGGIDLAAVKLAAIGPVTADALKQHDLTPAVIAEPHTIDALAAAIEAYPVK